jgi:hypothetical protein
VGGGAVSHFYYCLKCRTVVDFKQMKVVNDDFVHLVEGKPCGPVRVECDEWAS